MTNQTLDGRWPSLIVVSGLFGALVGVVVHLDLDTLAIASFLGLSVAVVGTVAYAGYLDASPWRAVGAGLTPFVGLAVSDSLLARDPVREAPTNVSLLVAVGLVCGIVAYGIGLGYRSLTENDVAFSTKRNYLTVVVA